MTLSWKFHLKKIGKLGLAKDDWWYDKWTSGSSKTWKISTKEHLGFRLSEIQVYVFLNVLSCFHWYYVQVTKWRFFSSKNKSSWERNTVVVVFFFFSTRIPVDNDGALNFNFLFHVWPGTLGTKCSSTTRWWYPLDMVKRGHYPCFRSSAFTADLAFRKELF